MPTLADTAKALVAPGMGILAADESEGTIAKRFAVIGLPVTFETRRDYREMLFRSREAMQHYITGAILTEETLTQNAADGTPFVAILAESDVMPGIKVDRGAFAMPGTRGEKITEGLDGLRARLDHYRKLGAKFAKWRGVIAVSDYAPSRNGIRANAHVLARYAALCQEAEMVPVVEPEVLADGEPGDHSIDRCAEVTGETRSRHLPEMSELVARRDGLADRRIDDVLAPIVVNSVRCHVSNDREVELKRRNAIAQEPHDILDVERRRAIGKRSSAPTLELVERARFGRRSLRPTSRACRCLQRSRHGRAAGRAGATGCVVLEAISSIEASLPITRRS